MKFIKVVVCVRWTDWTKYRQYLMCDILLVNDTYFTLPKLRLQIVNKAG